MDPGDVSPGRAKVIGVRAEVGVSLSRYGSELPKRGSPKSDDPASDRQEAGLALRGSRPYLFEPRVPGRRVMTKSTNELTEGMRCKK
jgi:hypothetical protein